MLIIKHGRFGIKQVRAYRKAQRALKKAYQIKEKAQRGIATEK